MLNFPLFAAKSWGLHVDKCRSRSSPHLAKNLSSWASPVYRRRPGHEGAKDPSGFCMLSCLSFESLLIE